MGLRTGKELFGPPRPFRRLLRLMLDRVGPRDWLTEPSEAEVAAKLFWIYIFADFGWFATARERHESLKQAQAWEHWQRVRRAGL